ncbi:MAG TPA: sugar ABC transporter substrate-binding protein [Ilumatobacteraceae bacterium]|nr:sugar ABC transporter substrate-binding protein [Ilumatobacteraceae bacterium]
MAPAKYSFMACSSEAGRRGRSSGQRSLRVLAVGVVFALVVAGCGRDDEDDADAPPDASGETSDGTAGTSDGTTSDGTTGDDTSGSAAEGSISVWAMGTEGENLDVLAEDFMAEFPDVSVEVTAVPWDAAHDRIVNSIAGGEVPDVSLIGSTWMGEFAKLGGLEPTPENIDPSQFFEGSWDTTVVDGVSYGVPWYVETRLIYYRTDLAEDGGFNQAPANWDELTQLVQAQADAGAEFGISLLPGGIGSWQTYMPFFWQAGGEILDDAGDFALGSDACVEALTFYDSFFEEGLAPSAVSDVPVEAGFTNGDVGAFISGPWMIGVVTDAGADPATWTVARQPTEAAGTSFVGGGNLAVFEQSDNKAAAWAFVEYLSRPEVQVKWYETVKDLPSVQAAWDDPALADDELVAAFGDQLEDAKSAPAIPNWEQIASAIDDQIEVVTAGETTPEDGCAAMQQEAESIGTGL